MSKLSERAKRGWIGAGTRHGVKTKRPPYVVNLPEGTGVRVSDCTILVYPRANMRSMKEYLKEKTMAKFKRATIKRTAVRIFSRTQQLLEKVKEVFHLENIRTPLTSWRDAMPTPKPYNQRKARKLARQTSRY